MHWKRPALFAGLFSIVIFLGLGAVICEGALRTPRFPYRPVPDALVNLPPLEDVSITVSDGVILRGSFIRTSPQRSCVLLLHGIGDARAGSLGFAPMLVKAGYSVLAPDSRGHGKSGGDKVTYGILEKWDTLAWAAWMRNEGCTSLYGLGESLGGAVLIQAAAEKPVFSAIVAECPYESLLSVAFDRISRAPHAASMLSAIPAHGLLWGGVLYARIRYGLDLREASPLQSAKSLKTPLLLIHGLKDQETLPRHSESIHQIAEDSELWLVPGAGHVSAYVAAAVEFEKKVLIWLKPPNNSIN